MLKYEKKRNINRKNGSLGGRPKTQKKPNGFENETENNQRKGKENKGKESKENETNIISNDIEVQNSEDKSSMASASISKKSIKEEKKHFAEFVTMTNAEYEKLVSTYGKEFADQCIIILDNYKGSKGKNYKSDYRAILSWVVDKAKQDGYKPEEAKRQYKVCELTEEEYIKRQKKENEKYV